VGAELFNDNGRTDRQTDMSMLIVPFRSTVSKLWRTVSSSPSNF